MRIQFLPGDPRAGTVAQMDSSRGYQLIKAGAAVEVREDGTPIKAAPAEGQASAEPAQSGEAAPAPARRTGGKRGSA